MPRFWLSSQTTEVYSDFSNDWHTLFRDNNNRESHKLIQIKQYVWEIWYMLLLCRYRCFQSHSRTGGIMSLLNKLDSFVILNESCTNWQTDHSGTEKLFFTRNKTIFLLNYCTRTVLKSCKFHPKTFFRTKHFWNLVWKHFSVLKTFEMFSENAFLY